MSTCRGLNPASGDVLPRDKPHISGKRQYYQIGDEINLNCTSGKSYPASELHWYINDQKVKGPSLRSYPEIISSHGLRQTQLGLTLTVTNDLFRDGSIKFKCIATFPRHCKQSDLFDQYLVDTNNGDNVSRKQAHYLLIQILQQELIRPLKNCILSCEVYYYV
ncbi:unnamed protein product [Bemisia tabaci]|uniref:Ig-like domain-containing protein n=1 Tax=Bemisia tabaci TaxID=7038 RepID=A0A9P0F426_BEMTA|nr:unnamed protein product [Bemisia tabaci]